MVELAVNPYLPDMSSAMDNSGTAIKDRRTVTVVNHVFENGVVLL